MSSCIGCHKEFIPKRKGQEYHDRACFLESTVKLKTCPECGNKFKRQYTGQVCCSSKCANVYRAKKNTKGGSVPCSYCGDPVHKMPSRLHADNFCDDICKIAWLRSDKNFYKNRKHTPEEIEKIRQASLNRNYDEVLTEESRRKMADAAKSKIWTPESREKLRKANLGKKLKEGTKRKIKVNAKYGIDNIMWKGDDAGYVAVHLWAGRHINTPLICVEKGYLGLPCSKRLELSNIDHTYRRVIEDWSWRCTRHHRIYDKERGLTHPKGQQQRFFAKAGDRQIRTFKIDGIVIENFANEIRL